MTTGVLAELAALKTKPIEALKDQWRSLMGSEPPVYSRRQIERRLAYRIQELAYGDLRPETRARLEALADAYDAGRSLQAAVRRTADRPLAGTVLIREWQGVEHRVTIRRDDVEYAGRSYRSLSAVARAITGTRWNGPLFFGLRRSGSR